MKKINCKSVSPLSGHFYEIPLKLDDINGINDFIESNKGKPVVIVQGLGFVGAVMSLVVANAPAIDYAVIGIDLADEKSYWKIADINGGSFTIKSDDPKVDLFYKNALKKGNLYATYDLYAYSLADIIVVDINLDVQKSNGNDRNLKGYNVELDSFRKAILEIGQHCKEDVLVLVETTVPPGTCENIVKPLLDEQLRKRGMNTNLIKIAHSYERVMPGPNYVDSIQNFYRVYSGINDESANSAESFLRTIIRTDKYPLTRLSNTTSTEMAKVLENSFRAVNIAFMEEWSRFAEEASVNLFEIVNAIRMRPTHQNLMYPGIGVGGYCLTKDPLLASWSKQNFFSGDPLSQSESAVRINDQMPISAFKFIAKHVQNLNNKRILLLGLSYLKDIGDTRFTPVELFYEKIINTSSEVVIHDPFIPYWEEKNVEIELELDKILSQKFDLIVYTTAHSIYKNNQQLHSFITSNKNNLIFDLVGILSENEIKSFNKSNIVHVLGRGDI